MRIIRIRAKYPFVQQVLHFAYDPCTITFHEKERCYIVTYRGRRVAFSERGGHIATGTPIRDDHHAPLTNREDYLVSMDIAERAILTAKLLG